MPPHGGVTVTVPGAVRLWEDAPAAHGRLPWAVLLEPAREIAEEGFPVGHVVARLWREAEALLAASETAGPHSSPAAPCRSRAGVPQPRARAYAGAGGRRRRRRLLPRRAGRADRRRRAGRGRADRRAGPGRAPTARVEPLALVPRAEGVRDAAALAGPRGTGDPERARAVRPGEAAGTLGRADPSGGRGGQARARGCPRPGRRPRVLRRPRRAPVGAHHAATLAARIERGAARIPVPPGRRARHHLPLRRRRRRQRLLVHQQPVQGLRQRHRGARHRRRAAQPRPRLLARARSPGGPRAAPPPLPHPHPGARDPRGRAVGRLRGDGRPHAGPGPRAAARERAGPGHGRAGGRRPPAALPREDGHLLVESRVPEEDRRASPSSGNGCGTGRPSPSPRAAPSSSACARTACAGAAATRAATAARSPSRRRPLGAGGRQAAVCTGAASAGIPSCPGSRTTKRAPPPGALAASARPPWAATTAATMASPRPAPARPRPRPRLARQKRSNTAWGSSPGLAGTVVSHLQGCLAAPAAGTHLDGRARTGVHERVAHEVGQHLPQLVGVAQHDRGGGRVEGDRSIGFGGARVVHGVGRHQGQVDGLALELAHLVEPGGGQEVLHEHAHPCGLLLDPLVACSVSAGLLAAPMRRSSA